MRNVYFILKRSVVAILLLLCQAAMAHPFEHGFPPMAANTAPVLCDTPRIFSFTPTSGIRGTVVTISGFRFIDATAVRFGGVLADSIWVLSDSTIRAKVGTGATGNVSVTTQCGTSLRPGFTFI